MNELIAKIDKYFNPDSPIEDSENLIGRDEDVHSLKVAIFSRGRQAIISGPRGIGKTSLINIVSNEVQRTNGFQVVMHKCSEFDSFETIVYDLVRDTYLNDDSSQESSIIDEFGGKVSLKILEGGTKSQSQKKEIIKKVIAKQVTPNSIAKYFKDRKILFVIDEFDRIKDQVVKTKVAETLRYFADESSSSNLIIVGINLKFSDFFDQHPSNLRSTTVLKISKINPLSLRKIISKGESELDVKLEESLKNLIVWISNGMPYYVHYLCKELCIDALVKGNKTLTVSDLFRIVTRLSKVGIFHLSEESFQSAINSYPESQNDPFLMSFKDIFPVDMSREDYSKIKKSLIYSLALLPDENTFDGEGVLKIFKKMYKGNEKYKLTKYDLPSLFRFINEDSDIVSVEGDVILFKDAFHKSYIRLIAFKEYSETKEIQISTISLDKSRKFLPLQLGELPQ